jgi:hypothetical protein
MWANCDGRTASAMGERRMGDEPTVSDFVWNSAPSCEQITQIDSTQTRRGASAGLSTDQFVVGCETNTTEERQNR